MNDSIKKASNALFRAVIFCMLIVSVMMTYSMINMAVIIDDNGGRVDDKAIEMLLQFASLYQGVFYGSAACIVLSILSNSYKASSSAVFFRTLILGAMTGVMFRGLGAVKAISEIGDKFLDVSDYEDITEEMLKDAGLTEQRAEELVETLQSDSALKAILASLFMCAAVYFLLSCTSLHNLLKKPLNAANCGGCEDANELERLNPQMLGGGMHYNNNVNNNSTMQAMPQFMQNINQSLGGGMENSKLISRYAAAMQQQPQHDHHDSALAHDLAAEGEFHDYAQAEADMTDDSSDYISQLQREENNGHRVTDEDFM